MKPEDQVRAQPIQTVNATRDTVREQDKVQLFLAYFGFFALIPLLTVKDSEYVRWHAKQGLVLGVGVTIALSIALAIVSAVFAPLGLIGCLAWPAILVVDVMAMMKAFRGERWRIPFVADVADKF